MFKELMKIVDMSTKAEDVLLFIQEKAQGIKHPQLRLDSDTAKSKRKKNTKRGKGKET